MHLDIKLTKALTKLDSDITNYYTNRWKRECYWNDMDTTFREDPEIVKYKFTQFVDDVLIPLLHSFGAVTLLAETLIAEDSSPEARDAAMDCVKKFSPVYPPTVRFDKRICHVTLDECCNTCGLPMLRI